MKQIKTLIIKEFHTHKTSFFMPAYIVGGLTLIILVLILVGYLKYGSPMVSSDGMSFNYGAEVIPPEIAQSYLPFWLINFFNLMLPYIHLLIIYGSMLNSTLNDDWRYKCVLFHNSFPVSKLKRILTKYGYVLLSAFVVLLGISIITNLIQLCFVGYYLSPPSFFSAIFYNFIGFLQAFIAVFLSIFVIMGTASFFSALYKNRTISKTLLTLGIFCLLFGLLLGKDRLGEFLEWLLMLYAPQIRLALELGDMDIYSQLHEQIMSGWAGIFSGATLLQIVFGVGFFALATVIMLKRKIE
jgi:hypothetical protein